MAKIKINVGRIRVEMAAKGLTVVATAAQLGIGHGGLNRILRGGWCRPFMAGRIARVLNIPMRELVEK